MIQAYWLPPDCPVELSTVEKQYTRNGQTLTIAFPVVDAQKISDIGHYLRQQQSRVLARRNVASIVNTLDRVAALWLSPDFAPRKDACKAVSVVTGFSEAMVAHAIDLEQISSRKSDLLAALDRELGTYKALDTFVPTPKGQSHAMGPQLIGGIFSANIPALPHLTVMRSFLVKSACLGRVSSGEPVYLPLYAESIASVDPELASCMAVLHWPHDEIGLNKAFLDTLDHLIAYGSDNALGEIRAQCPPRLNTTWHGHRMGFAYVGSDLSQDQLPEVANQLAYDFSVFDQQACLAPQACFVETGGRISPKAFAEALETSIQECLKTLPPRNLDTHESALLRTALDELTLDSIANPDIQLLSPSNRLQGVVALTPAAPLMPTPGDRFVRVVPVSGPDELHQCLEPVKQYLQCAAVVEGSAELKQSLAAMGVTRLCPPGRMGTPSMVWHHDGRPCLSELVRWCDEELVPPG